MLRRWDGMRSAGRVAECCRTRGPQAVTSCPCLRRRLPSCGHSRSAAGSGDTAWLPTLDPGYEPGSAWLSPRLSTCRERLNGLRGLGSQPTVARRQSSIVPWKRTGINRSSDGHFHRVVSPKLAWPGAGSRSPALARGRVNQPFSTSPAAFAPLSLFSRRSPAAPPNDTARPCLALRCGGFAGCAPASPPAVAAVAGAAACSAVGCPSGESVLLFWRLSGAMPGAEFLLRSSATCASHVNAMGVCRMRHSKVSSA